MRLLGVAKADGEEDDVNLTLLCVLCIRDNVRKEAVDAIKEVQNAGIQVVMVTGDRKETAVSIAKDAGLITRATDVAITSGEMAEMSDDELKKILPDLRVVSRALPTDKSRLVRCAQEISGKSGGAFDVTIAPVSTMWNFTKEPHVLPDAEEIAKAAELVDYTRMKLEGNQVTLPEGMMIDLGGIAKGYIADRVKAYLEKRGIKYAILSFGGNIVAIGSGKPDGSAWKVGIQDIDKQTGEYMLISLNKGGSTVTSGTYERGFDLDGVRYHHLLSAETGWPVQNELASVTIFSESSMEGDALSTTAFVLGTEKGLELIEGLEGVEAVFIAKDRTVTYSSGAKEYMVQ